MGLWLAVAESRFLSSTVAGALRVGCHVHSECEAAAGPCRGRDGVRGWAAAKAEDGSSCGACGGRGLRGPEGMPGGTGWHGRREACYLSQEGREGRGGKPRTKSRGHTSSQHRRATAPVIPSFSTPVLPRKWKLRSCTHKSTALIILGWRPYTDR